LRVATVPAGAFFRATSRCAATIGEALEELGEDTRVVAMVGRVVVLESEARVARARRELVDMKGMPGAPRGPFDVQRYRARASRVGSRYLVVDDSGAAVVDDDDDDDDDAFLIFPMPVARPGEPGERFIVDGARVRVVGRARRGVIDAATRAHLQDVQGGRSHVLEFDGSEGQPLALVVAEPDLEPDTSSA